jgi:uncharacterized membrane protein YoaK (UPF0700 family)
MNAPATPSPSSDDRDGPLPLLLLVLTLVTGIVDAVSYLRLGHVFVANMTGNVVFLGFAVAGAVDFSIAASIVAIAAFLVGALAGGRLATRMAQHRGRYLATAVLLKIMLIGCALVVAAIGDADSDPVRYSLIVLLAIAMGLQNATARRLGVADLTTTVLTLTLTGLAADSTLAGGHNPRPGRRVLAAITMLLGAAIGAFLVLRVSVWSALLLVLILLVFNVIVARRAATSQAAWTVGT